MSVRIPGKLLFLRHPRTGSSATVAALIKNGAKKAGEMHAFAQARGKEITVCTIRNPLDLLVSWYVLNPQWSGNFESFLIDYSHSAMVRDKMLHYFAARSDVLLLYDNLQQDFNGLLERFNLPPTRLYRHNTTSFKKPFKSYYTPETADIVTRIYKKDLALYERLKTKSA